MLILLDGGKMNKVSIYWILLIQIFFNSKIDMFFVILCNIFVPIEYMHIYINVLLLEILYIYSVKFHKYASKCSKLNGV